jgi:hypothetical protein
MIFKKGDLYQYSSSDINSSLMNYVHNHENSVESYTNDDYYSDFDTARPKVKKDFVKATKKNSLVVSPKIKEILHKEALSKSLCSFIEKDNKQEIIEDELLSSQSDDSLSTSQEINAPVDYISNSSIYPYEQTSFRHYPSSPQNLMQSFRHYPSSPVDVIQYPSSPQYDECIPAMIGHYPSSPVDAMRSYPSSPEECIPDNFMHYYPSNNLMNNEMYQSPIYMQEYNYQPDYIYSDQSINCMNNVYPNPMMESTFNNTQNLFGDVREGAVAPSIPHTYGDDYFYLN